MNQIGILMNQNEAFKLFPAHHISQKRREDLMTFLFGARYMKGRERVLGKIMFFGLVWAPWHLL